mmetsp:Transcript_100974/g.324185  ORF Transcript_100974/g.324185 Transcript_100974/m.324185 type:complete len:312 (+) Transcript_100974:256-1191(+)
MATRNDGQVVLWRPNALHSSSLLEVPPCPRVAGLPRWSARRPQQHAEVGASAARSGGRSALGIAVASLGSLIFAVRLGCAFCDDGRFWRPTLEVFVNAVVGNVFPNLCQVCADALRESLGRALYLRSNWCDDGQTQHPGSETFCVAFTHEASLNPLHVHAHVLWRALVLLPGIRRNSSDDGLVLGLGLVPAAVWPALPTRGPPCSALPPDHWPDNTLRHPARRTRQRPVQCWLCFSTLEWRRLKALPASNLLLQRILWRRTIVVGCARKQLRCRSPASCIETAEHEGLRQPITAESPVNDLLVLLFCSLQH